MLATLLSCGLVEGPRAAGRKALEFFGTVDILVNTPASDFICGQVVLIDGGYSAV